MWACVALMEKSGEKGLKRSFLEVDNGKVKTNVEKGSDDEGNSSGTPTEKVVEEDTSSEPFEVFQLFWNADML